MERPSHVESSNTISRYWTPQHVDVTDTPIAYAPPKAPWIDGYTRLRPLVRTDSHDRLARLRQQTHSIVEPEEIPVLPPLNLVAQPSSLTVTRRRLLAEIHAISARVMRRVRCASERSRQAEATRRTINRTAP